MQNESTSAMPFTGSELAGSRLATTAVSMFHLSEKPLRVAEVAELLDVDPTTIYRAIKNGDLKAYRVGRGRGAVRVPVESFADYQAVLLAAAATAVAS